MLSCYPLPRVPDLRARRLLATARNMPFFRAIREETSFPQAEQELITYWETHRIFQRSVEERPASRAYIFYDGPPFATGLPHYGHLVASTVKDIIPRYWTMRGHRVERRFGWDTHGLPIEMDVEKKLSLSGPSAIREYGIARFNEECRAGVLRYVAEWEKTITRLARWVDFRNDYKTMDTPFMETVWWVFRRLWDLGLVYRGMRVTPFSWRLSTPISNFEAGLDYRDVDDPALTVRLRSVEEPQVSYLIWTTTPWTLPSNLAAAVGEDIEYAMVETDGDGEKYWVAAARVTATFGSTPHRVLKTVRGRDLLGRKYHPLFDYFSSTPNAFQIIAAPHVSTEDGTGIVHMSPAFGEEDYAACKRVSIPPVDPVDEEGNFTQLTPDLAGKNIKEADKDVARALKAKGVLFRHDTIRHSYPYCWRSGTPLMYKAVPSWYVKAEQIRDRMVANNAKVHWVPEFVGTGRFANWLKGARDWSVSRARFWGTPLPIWEAADGEQVCIGSIDELAKYIGMRPSGLHPHEIDHLPFTKDGKQFHRVGDVFDCWFESGAMPYAQCHYPFENKEAFERGFPAKFIAEGLDQTRGWFYTLIVLSTALFDRSSFENVIVNGLVLAEDGEKMSKSKQNYPDPSKVFDTYGADALRAYLISSPVVRGEPLRFSEVGVRDVVRSVMLPLHHALSFFVTYANLENDGRGWDPSVDYAAAPAFAERAELDRWILSVLQSLVQTVNRQMEGYYLYNVVPPMLAFIDDLTNWYIRRSRRRFWRAESDSDKASAYATLHEVMVTFAKVLAPVMPFMAERMYLSLNGTMAVPGDSVHLAAYPQVDVEKIDIELERSMAAVREVVALGRALREKHKLKTRQPLRSVTIVAHDDAARGRLTRHAALLCEELNVKQALVVKDDADLATLTFKPNLRTLGKRLGPKLKEVGAAIAQLTRSQWDELESGGTLTVGDQGVAKEDVLVSRTPKGNVVLESSDHFTVALDTTLDETLRREGTLREVLRAIQLARAETPGLEVSHRIDLVITTDDAVLRDILTQAEALVRDESLATGRFVVTAGPAESPGMTAHHYDIRGQAITVAVARRAT